MLSRVISSHRGPTRLQHTVVHYAPPLSVREYVFYVFFRFQKNMTFYVFLK